MVGEWLVTTESQRAQRRTEDGGERFFCISLCVSVSSVALWFIAVRVRG